MGETNLLRAFGLSVRAWSDLLMVQQETAQFNAVAGFKQIVIGAAFNTFNSVTYAIRRLKRSRAHLTN